MAARDEDVGEEASTNQNADEAALVRELIEVLTALGNYLAAAQREFENQREVLGATLEASLGQYERAAECVRRLRNLVLSRRHPNDNGRHGID